MIGETVVCPACGGPVALTARGGRVRWHRPWRVGRGGRLYQSGAGPLCTGQLTPAEPGMVDTDATVARLLGEGGQC